jgi:signal transduction histidine kinase
MLLITIIYTSVSIIVLSSARRNLISQLKQFHLSTAEKLSINAADSIISGDYGFLMEQIRQLNSSGQIKGVKIIDWRGIIIASDDPGNIGKSDRRLSERLEKALEKGEVLKEITESELFLPVDVDGDILGFLEVNFDWDSEKSVLDREFSKTKIQLIYLAFIILAFGIGGSFVVSLILTRPITSLSKEIEAFEREIHSGSGNLIDPSDRDETIQLRHAFRRMAENLRNYLEELEKMSEDRVKLTCMAAIGQMSAQIAHEIRNSLYAIRSAISGIERKDDSSTIREYIDIIKDEALEMTIMADEFLRFAKVPSPLPVQCNIDDIIKRVTELLEPDLIEAGVKVIKEGTNRIPEIMGDPALLKQVFMNLFINAIQAMKEGGNIIVGYSTHEGWLEIHIKDTGPGIPEEIATMIFQPFFTTRAEGIGLGLATAYKIILAHHGDIKLIRSERGAHFLITLPLQDNKIVFKNETPAHKEQKV